MSNAKFNPSEMVEQPGTGLIVPKRLGIKNQSMTAEDRAHVTRVMRMLSENYGLQVVAFECHDEACGQSPVAISFEEGVGVHLRCRHRDLLMPDPAPKVLPRHIQNRRRRAGAWKAETAPTTEAYKNDGD